MFYKEVIFPKNTKGAFTALLNEMAEAGWEYVELFAVNPNRPQHLTILFRADINPDMVLKPKAEKPKEEPPAAPEVEEEPEVDEPAPAEKPAPAKTSKPGARRGRRPAAKKA